MEATPVLRVFGLGGCGGRVADAVARATAGLLPATAVDCDLGALGALRACQPFLLGQNTDRFRGLGSGGDAAAVRMAAADQSAQLAAQLDGVSLAIVVAGLGGGVGSGLLPAFLDLAAERNVRTVVFAVTPFAMEGAERLRAAGAAVSAAEGKGDLRLQFSNDDLAGHAAGITLDEAFARATETLSAGISLFWRLRAHPAYLALDDGALLSLVVDGRGAADLSVGRGQGPDRFSDAIEGVMRAPGLGLERKADSARAALVGVIGGRDLRLAEVGDAVRAVAGMLPPGTPVRLSTVLEPEAEGTITLVVIFFRSWAGAAEGEPASPAARPSGFAGTEPALVDGEDLDVPTFVRWNLRIDPA